MTFEPDRRRFLLAFGASTTALTTPLVADEPETPKAEPTETDARLALIVARYGKHLDDEARATVKADVASLVQRAQVLRKFALDNGDGPCPVFTPYRAPLA